MTDAPGEPTRASTFVTVLAWIVISFTGLGAVSMLLQIVVWNILFTLPDMHPKVTPGDATGFLVPIWYSYEPGGELRVVTARTSRKAQLLQRAGRFSLCAQTETSPYKYVSVEGPVVAIEPADLERDRRSLARRYFGAELGDRYIESTRDLVGNVLVRMRPERWLTVDYAKQ